MLDFVERQVWLLFLSGFSLQHPYWQAWVQSPNSKFRTKAVNKMIEWYLLPIKEKAMNNLKLLEVSESSQVTQVAKFPIENCIW